MSSTRVGRTEFEYVMRVSITNKVAAAQAVTVGTGGAAGNRNSHGDPGGSSSIASLVTGSVFGMSSALLKNAAMRYLPVILGGVTLALLSVGLVGSLMGYGFKNAVLLIGLPIMGGGMGAGAVPLVEILSGPMQMSSADLLSRMVPAVVIANTLAILVGVDYLETSFKSLRRGVHNRLEHWRNGNERGVSASPRQEELGSGLEK